MSDWQQEMTARIGLEVQRLRGERSQLWLEQRTKELGHRVSRGGLSQLETGNRRSISVAEWLVLAAALETPPLMLLWPKYPDGQTEMLPHWWTDTYSAHSWVGGRYTFEWGTRADDGDGAPELALSNQPFPLVSLVDQLSDVVPPLNEINHMLNGDADQIAALKAVLTAAEKKRRELERQIQALGGCIDISDDGILNKRYDEILNKRDDKDS